MSAFTHVSGDPTGLSTDVAIHCTGATGFSFIAEDASGTDVTLTNVAALDAHLNALPATTTDPVEVFLRCTDGSSYPAEGTFDVTITCGGDDTDGDGVCNHNDACAGVQCQAFGSEASPYTCVDTDVDTNNGDYQCQQEGQEHELCGGRGFTGPNCEVCAAGSGWNGDDANPQCVGCADYGDKYHTDSDSPTEPCVLAHCAVDYGVTKDGSFNSDSAASDICVACAAGYASPAGSGHCEPKTCVKGDGIVAGTIVCDEGQVYGETGSCGCVCDTGYEGTNCDTPSACVVAGVDNLNMGRIACLNGGDATGVTGGCGCNCPYPWDGNRCQDDVVDDCASSPCGDRGTCNDKVNDYECTCATGWEGGTCQLSVDDCVNHLCKNGAVCVDGHNDYTCSCALGWKGATCAEDANDCDPDPCNGHPCQDDGLNSYSCFCDAGYEGENCETASACVVTSVEKLNSGRIACLHGGLATGTTGDCGCDCGDIDYSGDRCQTHTDNCPADTCKNDATCTDKVNDYECSSARGFSGKDNDECADGKQEVSNICMTIQADGKAPAADIDLIKSLHGGNTETARLPAQRKARKQAVRDALREARKNVDADLGGDKKKGGRPAFEWLQDYAVELDEDNDYKDDSATKVKFKALPGSTLKMVVGFEGNSDVVVSARPRNSKKGEAVVVDRVVLATPTSTAVLGIESADGTDAIPTAKFTGKGADNGYDWKCRGDADNWVDPVGGTFKEDGETVECPIARGEPVARTFDVGSGEEQTTACKQDNALNYMGTAIYHDQTLCCVLVGCNDPKQLSDAFAAKSSGCGDNAGGHTEDVDGNCQTTQCEQAQLFDAYESGSCARR